MRQNAARIRSTICQVSIVLALPIAIAGCVSYRAMPLSSDAVESALKPADPQSLRISAERIHHPNLPGVTVDLKQGLTPDSAAIVAVVANPELRALRDQRGSAQAAVLQAKLLPNPQLSYNYDFVTGGNTAGAVNAYGWGLSYDLNALLAHEANLKASQANAQSVDLSVAWQEWQTAEAAKQSVYDLAILRAQVAVAEEIHQRLKANLDLLQRAMSAHLKSSTDVSAAASAEADAHAVVLQARRDAEHARLMLNRLLGIPASVDVRLQPGAGLTISDVPDAGAMLDTLQQRRLDLVALRFGYQSQEQALRAAVINQFPKINLGFDRSNDNTGVHMAGLAVTVDLPIFDRNQGSIAAESATRRRLFDEYVSRVFEARADIAQALADLSAIRGQIDDVQTSTPNLRQLVEAYRQAVDRGAGDEITYYALANDLAQRRLDALKLQQQLADATIALELASGWYLPESAFTATTHPTQSEIIP